jgi:hypothetical protein
VRNVANFIYGHSYAIGAIMHDNVSYFPSFVFVVPFVVIVIFSSRTMSPAKLYM